MPPSFSGRQASDKDWFSNSALINSTKGKYLLYAIGEIALVMIYKILKMKL
jgi:hypothetical protein